MICINRFWLDAARDNIAERKLFEAMVSPICVCPETTQGKTCGITMIAVRIDSESEIKKLKKKIEERLSMKRGV